MVLAKGSGIVPMIGARKRTQLAESLSPLQIALTAADTTRIVQAFRCSARHPSGRPISTDRLVFDAGDFFKDPLPSCDCYLVTAFEPRTRKTASG
jgi:hypothetical protein